MSFERVEGNDKKLLFRFDPSRMLVEIVARRFDPDRGRYHLREVIDLSSYFPQPVAQQILHIAAMAAGTALPLPASGGTATL